ncbi:MAG: prephenate dehydratase [Candidatus Bathyarchaeota archaeon]|nr:prephenate dehydratase [Candidatus Bathyarchaeota archaeon]MDW8022971.1 prephenate dehydratase [Nitrososphaerota archaeon]MDW8041079.1 prephenate dehydratase [Nitrososphaerota archaeon]
MGERLLKVAFQGETGAYSEVAVYKHFGVIVQPIPCKTFQEVFSKVYSGIVDYGVLPIENSIEGSVNQVYDLLLTHTLMICGEVVVKIDHCLIGNPNSDLGSIKRVYSHPQALAQCSEFLEKLKCEVIPTYDTAGSVKIIKERGWIGEAAIASEKSAEIYGMKVLARGIANHPENYTRFVIVSKEDMPPSGNDKTSIIFAVKHAPGALYEALSVFAKRGINLTKIESRPTRKKPWEYVFYLDFEGHRIEPKCTDALRELRDKTLFMKVLGSFPKAVG